VCGAFAGSGGTVVPLPVAAALILLQIAAIYPVRPLRHGGIFIGDQVMLVAGLLAAEFLAAGFLAAAAVGMRGAHLLLLVRVVWTGLDARHAAKFSF
jgi:hypothetical protein